MIGQISGGCKDWGGGGWVGGLLCQFTPPPSQWKVRFALVVRDHIPCKFVYGAKQPIQNYVSRTFQETKKHVGSLKYEGGGGVRYIRKS